MDRSARSPSRRSSTVHRLAPLCRITFVTPSRTAHANTSSPWPAVRPASRHRSIPASAARPGPRQFLGQHPLPVPGHRLAHLDQRAPPDRLDVPGLRAAAAGSGRRPAAGQFRLDHHQGQGVPSRSCRFAGEAAAAPATAASSASARWVARSSRMQPDRTGGRAPTQDLSAVPTRDQRRPGRLVVQDDRSMPPHQNQRGGDGLIARPPGPARTSAGVARPDEQHQDIEPVFVARGADPTPERATTRIRRSRPALEVIPLVEAQRVTTRYRTVNSPSPTPAGPPADPAAGHRPTGPSSGGDPYVAQMSRVACLSVGVGYPQHPACLRSSDHGEPGT